jgi:ketosteroid isomerase-like protein
MKVGVELAMIVLLSGAACARTSMDADGEREALMRVSREWAAAAAARDLERIVSYWADEATVLPPGQPAVVGKAAIRDFVAASLKIPGFSVTWEPEQASLSADGTLGYLVERNQFTIPDVNGVPQVNRGKAVTIWRKDPTGTWKCVVDTWNDNPRVP